jgi:hypothetical protein
MHSTTEAWFQSSPITVPDSLSEMVERVLAGKPDAGFSFRFSVPPGEIPNVTPCSFCGQLTLTVYLENATEFDAEVFTDKDGELRVDVGHPHECVGAKQHREFLNAPEPEEFDFDSLEETQ